MEIINLSEVVLTKDQISVLSKGLNFCPIPYSPDPGESRFDLDALHRRLRLRARFHDSNESIYDFNTSDDPHSPEGFKHRKFREPSTFNPVGPTALEAFILSNEHDYNNRPMFSQRGQNMTPGESKAIKELKNLDTKIVIKKSDKGTNVVIMNRNDYIKEGNRQLDNTSFYRKMDHDLTDQHRREVNQYIDTMYDNGELDISVVNYLHEKECKTANFYMLPKIHKGITPPPGRPIISANGCPTEKISKLVDHFLNPASTNHKSYVKDSAHFLNLIGNLDELPENSLLVTFDVSSLYTNIPHGEGLLAAKEALRKSRPGDVNPKNDSIINLLEFVLTKNNFQFDGNFYLQICGTAMGSKAAPSYANIYLDRFENKYVYTYHLQPVIWLRYLDDCFCIWQHGEEELNKFHTHLNSCNEKIKFTMEKSEEKIPFLDILIKMKNNKLETDLFCKPTDSHSYLHYTSAHPRACRDSIPYSQFLRIRKICTSLEDFDRHAINFACHFRRRGYPEPLLERAMIQARRKKRSELLSPKTKQTTMDQPVLVTTFHPNDNTLRDIVQKNWGILGKSTATAFLHKQKPMMSYKRPQNLKDMLTRADVRLKKEKQKSILPNPVFLRETGSTVTTENKLKQTQITNFFQKGEIPSTSAKHNNTEIEEANQKQIFIRKICFNIKCKSCPYINKSGQILCHSTKFVHEAKHNVTCQSSNLVYCITCKRCGQHYVGQTKRKLCFRLQEHIRSIKNCSHEDVNPLPVGLHFSQKDHQGPKDLEIQILDFINFHPDSEKSENIRKKVERKWIHTLRTPVPDGMNILD